MRWNHCLRIVTPGPSVCRRVRLDQLPLSCWVQGVHDVDDDNRFSCPALPHSDDAPPAPPAARLPASGGVSAAPQAQTPPDEALAALQGENTHLRLFQFTVVVLVIDKRVDFLFSLYPTRQKCEHNLSKPEFNPTSIKFKIQLVAVWVSSWSCILQMLILAELVAPAECIWVLATVLYFNQFQQKQMTWKSC